MLENKLVIKTEVELALAEERISKKKAYELFENGILNPLEVGIFSSLATIHRYLFEDIYNFAEEIKRVNIAKGNFRFVPVMYLKAALKNIDKMPQTTFDEIIEKYVEIKHLLNSALTDNINDRDVYMKGIDASYYYEGYNIYTVEDLIK